jgi:hypothetical protein
MSAQAIEGQTYYRKRGNVTVPNGTVYDERLSYNALGILVMLMARPPGTSAGYRQLLRPGVGERAILGAFKELVAAGYRMQFYRRERASSGNGWRLLTDTYLSEEPLPLDEFKAWHKQVTGQDPIEAQGAPWESAGKATLASDHAAHKREAHKRRAQPKGVSTLRRGAINAGASQAAEDGALAPCLGCDAQVSRLNLDHTGNCQDCRRSLQAQAAAVAAARAVEDESPQVDPAEAAAARQALFQASLERQAKRLHITVDELVAMREQAGQESPAAVALGINKRSRSAPALTASGARP